MRCSWCTQTCGRLAALLAALTFELTRLPRAVAGVFTTFDGLSGLGSPTICLHLSSSSRNSQSRTRCSKNRSNTRCSNSRSKNRLSKSRRRNLRHSLLEPSEGHDMRRE